MVIRYNYLNFSPGEGGEANSGTRAENHFTNFCEKMIGRNSAMHTGLGHIITDVGFHGKMTTVASGLAAVETIPRLTNSTNTSWFQTSDNKGYNSGPQN